SKPVEDSLDVNNNGITSEIILPAVANSFTITANENLVIDSYITPKGESGRRPVFDGTKETAVGFTPGTNAIYTLDIFNNRKTGVDSLVMYVPIPKEKNDFGSDFQNNAFKWNMKLAKAPRITIFTKDGSDITKNYEVAYTNKATNQSNWENAIYTSTFIEDATMIKVTNTKGISPNERIIFQFEYIVDESIESVEGSDKLSSINDYRPVYDLEASGSSGRQFGTRVGAQLVIGEIKGLLFDDVNIDGVYTKGTDKVLADKEVTLQRQGDEEIIKTKTNAEGMYQFEGLQNGQYDVNFNNGISEDQHFTFTNRAVNKELGSYAINTGEDSGLIKDIEPTATSAGYSNAGVFNYNPQKDLKINIKQASVSLPAKNVQTQFNVQLETEIKPDFYQKIQPSTNALKWSIDDNTIASMNDGLVGGLKQGKTKAQVTISDVFGNTNEAEIEVDITSNNLPVISASNIEVERNATFNPLTTPTANDSEDGDITKNIKLKSSDVNTSIIATYTVVVEVSDKEKNKVEKSYQVKIIDTTSPIITSKDSITYERLSSKTTQDLIEDLEIVLDEEGTITSNIDSKVDFSKSGTY
ncbi:MAG: SdrD B-like domain-containing protein, partial [Bacilli bacterium]